VICRAGVLVIVLGLLAGGPVLAETAVAQGGVLRWLDKLSGATQDVTMATGEVLERGQLTIRLDECRYPANDPSSDAFVHLTIIDNRAQVEAFNGWMIASSPALSAMDHARYDVWVLNCDVPGLEPAVPDESDGEDQ
jgi:hypothetical protein